MCRARRPESCIGGIEFREGALCRAGLIGKSEPFTQRQPARILLVHAHIGYSAATLESALEGIAAPDEIIAALAPELQAIEIVLRRIDAVETVEPQFVAAEQSQTAVRHGPHQVSHGQCCAVARS